MSLAQFDTADPERPATLTVVGDELAAAVARSKSGEFVIHQMKVGETNAEWILSVTWPPVAAAAAAGDDFPY